MVLRQEASPRHNSSVLFLPMTLCCGRVGVSLVDEVSWHWHTMLDLFSVQTINPRLLGLKKNKPPCEAFSSVSITTFYRILSLSFQSQGQLLLGYL